MTMAADVPSVAARMTWANRQQMCVAAVCSRDPVSRPWLIVVIVVVVFVGGVGGTAHHAQHGDAAGASRTGPPAPPPA